jgi:hypothetical protein
MEEVAYIDLPTNRCHWILIDAGNELVAACGAARSTRSVKRTSTFVDGPMIPGCCDCAEIGQPKEIRRLWPVIVRMPWNEYEEACGSSMGFCVACHKITNSRVEPDARRYECETCGKRMVYGMDEALQNGFISIA